MAQFLLASINIEIGEPPFGAGDTVTIYYDDSAQGIAVYVNGSPFSSFDANLGAQGANYNFTDGITSTEGGYAIAGYSFCSGSDLIWFRMLTHYPQYPFMEIMTTVDSPVCDVGGGAVCDIGFVGAFTITHSTDKSTGGSIAFQAQSSNGTIKYSLHRDFDYATGGTEMTAGVNTISGISPGTWTLYIKDANDCTAIRNFKILYKPVDVEHYRFSWTSLHIGPNGQTRDARVRIYEREYAGDLVEVDYASESPFQLVKPSQGDLNEKFHPIHPTNAVLSLMSRHDYQYLPLYTQDDKRYRVVYEVDEGSGFTPVWQGFILPSVYTENFQATPYAVDIRIADNVKILESQDFSDDEGGTLKGSMKLIKVIALIMKKTGLSLNIRSGINIFEENHSKTSADDPLDQTYIDVSCYYRRGEGPFTCMEVLEAILRPFGARLYQYDNSWIIEEIDRAVSEYAYRVFDSNGDYVSNSTFDPIVDIKGPSSTQRAALVTSDHGMEIIPSYGKIDIVSKLNHIGAIVSGGFEREDLLSPESELDENGNPIFGAGSVGVFVTEEGFRDWTLRLNGASGVSFGRVVLNSDHQLAHASKVRKYGLNVTEQSTRSVGAFYFNLNSWSGNVRDAYLESAAKPFQYGPGDEIRFAFEFAAATPPDSGFMVVAFVLKVGDMYLHPGLLWDSTPHIMRYYPTGTSGFQTFDLVVPAPDTTVVVDSTIQVRIYYFTKDFYDWGIPSTTSDPAEGTDGESALRAMPTADIEWDFQADVRGHVTISSPDSYIREIVALVPSTAEDEAFKFIRPLDYNGTTNAKVFMVTSFVTENQQPVRVRNRKHFYLDNVILDSLIKGQPAPEEDRISVTISKYLTESKEIELYNFDVPNITNAKNIYNNYFRLSDGTPTAKWARTGIAESLPLQAILLNVVGSNYAAPTFRLTGSLVNEFSRIGINNYLRLTKPGSSMSVNNTEFSTDLSGWTQPTLPLLEGTWSWTADNDGSAEVTLATGESSKKIYQNVTHAGGYIDITVQITAVPTGSTTREDVLWALFYRGGKIIHTEKLKIFEAPTSTSSFSFTHRAFAPGSVDRIGFFINNVTGSGTCKYQVSEFSPAGTDVVEIYQIASHESDEFSGMYNLVLIQQNKSYISLAGIDTGGTGQNGSTTGRAHSSGYSAAFS